MIKLYILQRILFWLTSWFSLQNSEIAGLEVWILQKKLSLPPSMVGALTQSYIKNGGSKIRLHKTLGNFMGVFSSVFIVNCTQVFMHWNISTSPSYSNETRESISQYCFAFHEMYGLGPNLKLNSKVNWNHKGSIGMFW